MEFGGKEINMARHDILQGEISDHVSVAVSALKDGYVIVAPLENSYALVADAFFHDAVRALHVLRDDALGIAAQVAIANKGSIDGIARSISDDARVLMDNFWPGALSLNLKPQLGLSWDLGDANSLDQLSVRVPSSKFLLEILKKTGPLAIASAATVGASPIRDSADLDFSEVEVAAVFTAGVLSEGAPSTVIDFTGSKPRIVREGSIPRSEITALVSDISGA
jgi:tRNA threonylcarbamoyl adenosine modification protein (Sua5/YciO/YrdC/YwlC family)